MAAAVFPVSEAIYYKCLWVNDTYITLILNPPPQKKGGSKLKFSGQDIQYDALIIVSNDLLLHDL